MSIPCPSESTEQIWLFQWAKHAALKWPEINLMMHIPNEGKRSRATGGRMKAEGLKKGVPDIFLPVARGRYYGLFIELKRQSGGKVSQEQKAFLEALNGEGYKAIVCHGFNEAADAIEAYMEGGHMRDVQGASPDAR